MTACQRVAPRDFDALELRDLTAAQESFAYYGESDVPRWTADRNHRFRDAFGPVVEGRDLDTLETSNGEALKAELGKRFPRGGWHVETFNHWAVGWIGRVVFRLWTKGGKQTRVARFLAGWRDALDDYPVADEDDLGERELEEAYTIIELYAYLLNDRAPEDWAHEIFLSLDDLPRENESNERGIIEALENAGWLKCPECENEETAEAWIDHATGEWATCSCLAAFPIHGCAEDPPLFPFPWPSLTPRRCQVCGEEESA